VESLKTVADATTQVVGGEPRLSGKITSQSLTSNTLSLTVQLTNAGTGDAENIQITQIPLRTLAGTGAVTMTVPSLPVPVGSLAAGASAEVTLTLNVPSTVRKFSITEDGAVQDASGTRFNYSIGQVVFP
jgi:hypothetical protein